VFDVAITMTVKFREVIRGDGKPVVFQPGAEVGTGNVSIVAPRLEERTPFNFYVVNTSPYIATVAEISATYAWPSDSARPGLVLNRDPMSLITFSPAET
jgi:hypothetical protein